MKKPFFLLLAVFLLQPLLAVVAVCALLYLCFTAFLRMFEFDGRIKKGPKKFVPDFKSDVPMWQQVDKFKKTA